ncbi:SGNH/GDSL hydrolase family protein [Bifidobacterium oedipodis]|uniref:SGNH hydrolase-type esterase domain-containing protein n=1 Tax=Bifidobacterium oedipodis TaxID=2675322 RepID=A0A7Y0HQM8_9BIFI|nr:SGNH/GDSL hydrolase family protein [Bifidobacterium sp. DSM 109957]NMM93075.1 hypothetical protein [Bifidobacterium sp. DSM 109957]
MFETIIYAFGDSIVNGHVYPQQGSVERVAAAIGGCRVIKMARNGATICSTPLHSADLGGQILKQTEEVPADSPAPDVIVFDGLTNDVHQGFLRDHPGELTAPGEFDPSRFAPDTYAGCFESTIAEFRRCWPNAAIVYLAVHKNGAQSFDDQMHARRLALGACEKWGVVVADVWADSDLDTRRDEDRVKYSFDALGNDGLPGTPETITYDHPDRQPSGTHPNFPAIDRFYTPVVARVLTSMMHVGR